jgi:LemA protein
VLTYNNKIESVPTNLLAKAFHFRQREYFEADEAARTAPTVEF